MKQLKLKMPGGDSFAFQEAFKYLRTNLQFCGADVKIIGITSCLENEGKSLVSLNVARAFAEMGKRTLFLDADMRKSVIVGRYTNEKDTKGLSEVLSGQVTLNDCLYATNIETLYMVLSGAYPPNPAELLSGKYSDALMKSLREYFDYVIIDTPPLGSVIDAAVIAPKTDGMVLVVGINKLDRKLAAEVLDQLKMTGTRILGAVKNSVSEKKGSYYYTRGKNYYAAKK